MLLATFSILFIIPCIYSQNTNEDLQGLTQKISLLQDQFDLELSNIQKLTDEVTELKNLTNSQADEIIDLKSQVENLKEITKIVTVVESCSELARHGITESRKYDLDFDGKNQGEG